MNIDDLTIGQARELSALFGAQASSPAHNPYPMGPVFIRTVTMHYTGRLVEVGPSELVLEDAAWVADSGRFGAALASGDLKEVEPFPAGRVVIGRGAVVDCVAWPHDLPRCAK